MRILIADDHPIYAEGLANLLRSYDYEVVGQAHNGLEALEMARTLSPDVILMDASMPEMDGIEAAEKILAKNRTVRILILTGIENEELIFKAVKAGVSGFLLKNLDGDYLNESLQDLQKGKNPFSPGIQQTLLNEFSRIKTGAPLPSGPEEALLTPRQMKIMADMARDKTYKEIADEMCLTEATIKYHIKNIKTVLNLQHRNELVAYYLEKQHS